MKSARTVLAATALLLLVAGSRAAGPEWPGWRGPARDAMSRETGLASSWPAGGPPLLWKATGMGAGFSSVAIVDGRIYTMGDRDGAQYLLAFSAAGGAPLWKTRVGPVWSEERNLYFVGPTPTGPVETLTFDLQGTGQPTMAAHR